MDEKVKILVVDDSIVYRQILLTVINQIQDAECIGTAASGQIALRKINSLQPDLVLLDVVMPDMDGVQTLQAIKQQHPKLEAIMVSSFDMNNAKETLRSLEIGALDFIPKPQAKDAQAGIHELVTYLQPLIHLVQTKRYAHLSRTEKLISNTALNSATDISSPVKETPKVTTSFRTNRCPSQNNLILIGISTGGPRALDQLIPDIKTSLSCPVLIVQHMPPLFTESLAMKLDNESSMKVMEAKGGERLKAGEVYIAQGGKHLLLKKHVEKGYCLEISETAPVNNCRPSVDVLFQSVADNFKGNVLAVIMTGMGRDGTEGVKKLKQGNCHCIIQDKITSVVWGMPGSVYEAGLADEVVPLNQLSEKIIAWAN